MSLSSKAITEIITKAYQDFHIARGDVTLDGFRKTRIIPLLVKHIQKHYSDMTAAQLNDALENGAACIYDDDFSRSKNFDIPTMQRWLIKYREGSSIKKPGGLYIPPPPLTDEAIEAIKAMRKGYVERIEAGRLTAGQRLRRSVRGDDRIGETLKVKIDEPKNPSK